MQKHGFFWQFYGKNPRNLRNYIKLYCVFNLLCDIKFKFFFEKYAIFGCFLPKFCQKSKKFYGFYFFYAKNKKFQKKIKNFLDLWIFWLITIFSKSIGGDEMPDFLRVVINTEAKGGAVAYPTFICGRVKDIMVQGGKFKAAWDEENLTWITDKNLIPGLIDREIDKAIDEAEERTGYSRKAYREIRYARLGTYKVMNEFKNYIENQMADNYIPLDHKLVFKSDPYRREDYSTTRLPYDIVEMETPAFDKMIETLYYPQERKKIMWAIGAILSGDSKKIQKFFAFYGLPGKGKGTIIKIIEQLFQGYYSTFNADALTNRSSQFSMEPFKNNPLVAIDADAELKYITDNTRLNTIVSHEYMIINEKHKQQYRMKIESMLFVATNDPIQITSVSSGLMRRLVDIRPSGNLIDEDEYFRCEDQIPFELGGIAYKCLQV